MRRRSSFASVPRVGRLLLCLWWKEGLPVGRVLWWESAFLYRVAHYNSYLYTAHL